jgi:hypothetical protein
MTETREGRAFAMTGTPAEGIAMRGYTLKEKAKITAGAVAAIVIVGWLLVIALALMSAG